MKNWQIVVPVICLFIACNQPGSSGVKMENTTSGRIHISVDESFKPVITEQIKVFESSFPDAHLLAEYKSEAECLRDLQKDSTRMVIISRGLTEVEQNFYDKKLEYRASFARIATDAIAVIVNNNNADSVFTLNELKLMLAGKGSKEYNIVVDGKSATSTVRYLMDTLLKGQPLGKNVTAAKSSEEVINYIASSSNAVGFVGVSWISVLQNNSNPNAGKVKMALIECKNCDKDVFARPSQQTILFKQYPLVRGLYYVLKENFAGLGSGFSNFLSLERGQLIFSRANLVPSMMQFNRRRSQIKESE